jgi:hypothetical protein
LLLLPNFTFFNVPAERLSSFANNGAVAAFNRSLEFRPLPL